MHYNKEKHGKFLTIGLILLISFLIFFTGLSIKHNRRITKVEGIIKDGVSIVVNFVSTPFKYVDKKWEIFMKSNDIYDEYLSLKAEQEETLVNDNIISELENENKKLKELLELNSSILEYEKINATVIYRGANSWLNSFVIDKGKNDGVDDDMAVVVNGVLVGYTSNVGNHTSTVTLLTTPNTVNKISVRIEVKKGKYAYGLLYNYDEENNLYVIEGISDYHKIPVGSTITTTGLTGKFPGGIVIGEVKSVSTDIYDLKKVVMVTPSIDLDDVTYVTVLKREAISQ